MRIIICLITITLASCSLIQKQGIRITSGIVADGSYEVETDGNLEFLDKALPANLKLVESMLYLDPTNLELLATLTKGYVGYAFAINETNYLQEQLQDIENGNSWKQAVMNYSKGFEYGLRYLQLRGITYKELAQVQGDAVKVSAVLDNNLDVDDSQDFEVVFYTAQALGSLINLQKGNLQLVSLLPLVKSLFDWGCHAKPDFNFGACQIFYASYDSSRPRTLGGNPKRGKTLFRKAIRKWPKNNLIKIAYLQYYVIPMIDEEEFAFVAKGMQNSSESLTWDPRKKRVKNHLTLFNSIAQKRFSIISKFKDDIF